MKNEGARMKKALAILLLLIMSVSVIYADLNEGLIAEYLFTNGSTEDTVGDNDGNNIGAVPDFDRFGVMNNALRFDGNSNWIQIPDNDVFEFGNSDFSISLWMQTDNVTQEMGLISKWDASGNGWRSTLRNDQSPEYYNFVCFGSGTESVLTSEDDDIFDSEWHQITLIREAGETLSIYVDGVLKSEVVDNSGTLPNSAMDVFIGRNSWENNGYFDGLIDDVRIYNRAISETEVGQLYDMTLFCDEFHDLNDNQAPEGWEQYEENPDTGFQEGRFYAYITDAYGGLKKSGIMPPEAESVQLEWDGNISYTQWGGGSRIQISDDSGVKLRANCINNDQHWSGNNRIRIEGCNSDGVYITLYEEFISDVFSDFHFTFVVEGDSCRFQAVNNSNSSEYFNVTANITDLIPEFDLQNISEISFDVHATTDNNHWFDNIEIDIEPDLMNADFTVSDTLGISPLTVQFTDTSTESENPITTWEWDFENDGTIDSYEQNPTWVYHQSGLHSVSLTVSDGTYSDTEIKTDYINVTLNPEPVIYIDPSSLDFGDVRINTTSTLPITVYNYGEADLIVSNIISSTDRFSASLPSKDINFTLSSLESQIVNIYFTPDELSPISGQLYFMTNDPENSMLSYAVIGTGVAPTIDSPQYEGVQCDTTYLTATSPYKLIEIENIGTMDLTINSINFSENTDVFDFSYPNLRNPIEPGTKDSLYINFSPISAGVFVDSVVINNNSENAPMYKIQVKGVGEYAPPKDPQNIQISMNGDDAILSWDSVTENIFDQPLIPDGYIILFSEIPNEGQYYWYLGDTTELTYTHVNVGLHRTEMYYKVKAFIFYDTEAKAFFKSLEENRKITWKEIREKLPQLISR